MARPFSRSDVTMSKIIFTDSAEIIETIDSIRDAIGRVVSFYTVTSSIPCSACGLDPVTDTSVDPFCTVCSGIHWMPQYTVSGIQAHVTWGNADQLNWVTGGQFFEGDCRIQIKHTEDHEDIADNAKYLIVDNKELTIQSKILRGVPTINRILLDLIEKEK